MKPPILVLKAGDVTGEQRMRLISALLNGQAAVIEVPEGTPLIAAAATFSTLGEWLQTAAELQAQNKPITPGRIAVERSSRRRS